MEVIAPPHGPRLRGFFDAATADRIAEAAGGDAAILILPGALLSGAFAADGRLRLLGRFAGRVTRAPLPKD